MKDDDICPFLDFGQIDFRFSLTIVSARKQMKNWMSTFSFCFIYPSMQMARDHSEILNNPMFRKQDSKKGLPHAQEVETTTAPSVSPLGLN